MRQITEGRTFPLEAADGPLRLAAFLDGSFTQEFHAMAALPSNIEAVEGALLFAAGVEPLVAIVGPSGWGKSHLLASAARHLNVVSGIAADHLDVAEWLARGSHAGTNAPLLLDNVQSCLGSPRLRVRLRLLLERRAKGGRRTLLAFTAPAVGLQVRSALPHPRDWLVANLRAPSPAERVLILQHMAASGGMSLSPVLVRHLSRRLHGNGRTLGGALQRLKLHQGTWMTPAEVLRACGLLNPFLTDDASWDLREHIAQVLGRRLLCPTLEGVGQLSLAAYLMLRLALLSEDAVADYLRVKPKEAYAWANELERKLRGNRAIKDALGQLIACVVDALDED